MRPPITLLQVLSASIIFSSASALNSQDLRQPSSLRTPEAPNHASPATVNEYHTEYYFHQLIDHENPSLGTFKQRYFFSDQHYRGPGSPIVIGTPGEKSADGYHADLTEGSIMSAMLENWGAAGVVLEHRYWGKSSPYDTLTAKNLTFLTVNQAIEDYKYFVENVDLPWASGGLQSTPSVTPWVNIGCSYPGLLVAFTQEKYPDLFAAGYASSAPVNADGDFWEYWEPIEEGMPKNCSADLSEAVAHIDKVLSTGTTIEVKALKRKFGLQVLANDDFAYALQYPLNTWQDLQADTYSRELTSGFYKFCDTIETKADNTINMDVRGVGMPLALENWAKAFKASARYKECRSILPACFSTANPKAEKFTVKEVLDQHSRAWTWMLCTQLGWFQDSSIVSSQVTPAYFQRQCSNYFPPARDHIASDFSDPIGKFNRQFEGWNIMAERLFVVNGQFDPWRSVSLSPLWMDRYPELNIEDILDIHVIPNATHCWDYRLVNGELDPNVKKVQTKALVRIREWLQDWYTSHPDVPNNLSNAAGISGKENAAGATLNNISGAHATVSTDLKDTFEANLVDTVEAMAVMKGWEDPSRFPETPESVPPEQ
ncbi:hypothetical protein FRC05_002829 [Tulasnella sp. 425]|nr:hypothetical protein FRC05_002829 [Tulasnella sp. 425]